MKKGRETQNITPKIWKVTAIFSVLLALLLLFSRSTHGYPSKVYGLDPNSLIPKFHIHHVVSVYELSNPPVYFTSSLGCCLHVIQCTHCKCFICCGS